jgi:hypothetical protein
MVAIWDAVKLRLRLRQILQAAPFAAANEHAHLRQYLPRHVSLRDFTQADLDGIVAELNGRPRQTARLQDTIRSTKRSVAMTA